MAKKPHKNRFNIFNYVFVAGFSSLMMSSQAFAADGEAVFKSTCKNCHTSGMMGAPKFGDKADWEPRIAQGLEALHSNAIKGFTGKKGFMPPKGGKASLTDDEVKAAVEYMVNSAK